MKDGWMMADGYVVREVCVEVIMISDMGGDFYAAPWMEENCKGFVLLCWF